MTAIGRTVLNYFGSKVSTAHKYPPPKHDIIVEPFAGGAGYSLCYWDRQVVLCDLNPDVADVWDYVIHADPDEIRALPLIEPGQRVDELGLARGPSLLIGYSVQIACAHAPCPSLSAGWATQHAGRAAVWGAKRRERVAQVSAQIKHWLILRCSYDQLPQEWATWFVDPPYQDAGKNYPFGSDRIDYTHLAAWCRSREGQTIVCENEGADWLPFETFIRDRCGATLDNGKSRRRTEVIWTQET